MLATLGVAMTRLRFATLLLCAAAMTAHARAPQWSFVDLGTLGSDTSVASAVSNRGDVAGYSITPVTGGPPGSPTALMHAFVWRNGALTDLGDPGRDGVAIYDMNENGMLVGYGVNTGVVTWKDGQWATLGFDGSPHAINNSGMIVGQHGFGVHVQAFVYTGTALLGLGTFGGTDSSALGVNDRGQ